MSFPPVKSQILGPAFVSQLPSSKNASHRPHATLVMFSPHAPPMRRVRTPCPSPTKTVTKTVSRQCEDSDQDSVKTVSRQ
eukprot:811419-Pyramimonas_sp.AAC.1